MWSKTVHCFRNIFVTPDVSDSIPKRQLHVRYLFDWMNVHMNSFFIDTWLIHPRLYRFQLGATRHGRSYNFLNIGTTYFIGESDTLEGQMHSVDSYWVERVYSTDYRRVRGNDLTNRIARRESDVPRIEGPTFAPAGTPPPVIACHTRRSTQSTHLSLLRPQRSACSENPNSSIASCIFATATELFSPYLAIVREISSTR